MKRVGLLLIMVVLAGCSRGPTPQEEYSTALEIFEKEREELAACEAVYERQRQAVSSAVRQEFMGELSVEKLKMEIDNLQRRERLGLLKTDELVAFSKEHSEKSVKALVRLKELFSAIQDKNSDFNKTIADRCAKLASTEALREQQQRLNRARKMLKKAEARLK